MECNFAIAILYNLDFKTDEMDNLPASCSSSTTEDFSKRYSRMLELLEFALRLLELLVSTTKCYGACRTYTPGIYTWKNTDSYHKPM
jgi:hypothetical protein